MYTLQVYVDIVIHTSRIAKFPVLRCLYICRYAPWNLLCVVFIIWTCMGWRAGGFALGTVCTQYIGREPATGACGRLLPSLCRPYVLQAGRPDAVPEPLGAHTALPGRLQHNRFTTHACAHMRDVSVVWLRICTCILCADCPHGQGHLLDPYALSTIQP